MTWSITVRIRPTSKHAEFLVPVGTHSSVSRLLSHTAIVLPLGNPLTLQSLTFRTSFSIFHCLPALSISRTGEAITKTIPRDRRKLIKLMLRKSTFLPPRSHLIGQFIKRHLVTIQREQHILAQWLRQYFVETTACAVYRSGFRPDSTSATDSFLTLGVTGTTVKTASKQQHPSQKLLKEKLPKSC